MLLWNLRPLSVPAAAPAPQRPQFTTVPFIRLISAHVQRLSRLIAAPQGPWIISDQGNQTLPYEPAAQSQKGEWHFLLKLTVRCSSLSPEWFVYRRSTLLTWEEDFNDEEWAWKYTSSHWKGCSDEWVVALMDWDVNESSGRGSKSLGFKKLDLIFHACWKATATLIHSLVHSWTNSSKLSVCVKNALFQQYELLIRSACTVFAHV